jgi:hypothetical protein
MKNNGGPAFPIQKEMLSTKIWEGHLSEITTIPGMTLRDYCQIKMMQSVLSSFDSITGYLEETGCHTREEVARAVYEIAETFTDEFIENREY